MHEILQYLKLNGEGLDSEIAAATDHGGLAMSRPLASAVLAVFIIACIFLLPPKPGTFIKKA